MSIANSTFHLPPHTPIIILSALLASILFPILYHHISRDYKVSKSTLPSYLRTFFLRPLRLRNTLQPPTQPTGLWLQRPYLESLPPRSGTRPCVAGIAPQRQITQQSPEGMYDALSTSIRNLAAEHRDSTYLGRTSYEPGQNTVLFSRRTTYTQTAETHYLGEIAHAHLSDGSLHLTLHPADVKTVIEAGWGERHPLARSNWWWPWGTHMSSGYVIVYAPRDDKELGVAEEIVKAAIWWVSGTDSKIVEESWS